MIRIAAFQLTFVAPNRTLDFGGGVFGRTNNFCHYLLRVCFGKDYVLINLLYDRGHPRFNMRWSGVQRSALPVLFKEGGTYLCIHAAASGSTAAKLAAAWAASFIAAMRSSSVAGRIWMDPERCASLECVS